ncbi:hypothetical protein ACJX0J_037204, partial [Zea mays]
DSLSGTFIDIRSIYSVTLEYLNYKQQLCGIKLRKITTNFNNVPWHFCRFDSIWIPVVTIFHRLRTCPYSHIFLKMKTDNFRGRYISHNQYLATKDKTLILLDFII